MFDDLDNNKKSTDSSDSKKSSWQSKDPEETPSSGGQKITDSPFKVKKEDIKEQDQEKQEDSRDSSKGQDEVYPKKSSLADKEEPEDMFASLEDVDPGDLKDQRGQNLSGNGRTLPSRSSLKNTMSGRGGAGEGNKEVKKILIRYIVLGVIAAIVIATVVFWGTNALLSPTGQEEFVTPDPDQESQQENKEDAGGSGSSDAENEEQNSSEQEDEDKEDNNKEEKEEKVDSDGDGLADAQEEKIGTDPQESDTDGDGLSDREEVIEYGTNPLKEDTDGDGLTDFEEVEEYGTDPLKEDTDGDGYSDGEEVKNNFNPLGEGKLNN